MKYEIDIFNHQLDLQIINTHIIKAKYWIIFNFQNNVAFTFNDPEIIFQSFSDTNKKRMPVSRHPFTSQQTNALAKKIWRILIGFP